MNIDKSKVLIVGGAGFVGSNLAHYLLNHFDLKELWIIDNLLSSDISNIPNDDKVTFLHGSVTNDQILKKIPEHLDFVFHLACYHGNQSSIANPFADHENNTYTSLKLFDRLKDFSSLKRVVYAAAGCAVAEKTYKDAKATQEDAPVTLFHDSPYSISKLIGEMYGNYYYQRFDLPFVKARFQNVYGPREILGAGQWRGTVHTVWRNVTPTFIWKSLHKEALPLDNGGNASRDFIFVEDIVRGLVACAEKGQNGEAYNLASGIETSILQLAKLINELTENSTPLQLKPARDWDRSGKRFGSVIKSKKQLDFCSEVSLKQGIKNTIEWTKDNYDLINTNIKKHDYFLK